MKLRNLLQEVMLESSASLEDVIEDCSYFLDRNKNMLKVDGQYLIRGTPRTIAGYEKIPKRSRQSIKGNPFLYYFFETMKPANVPSRKEMIPCQGLKQSIAFRQMNPYSVVPIGSKYKLVWAPGIEDFNYNKIFGESGNIARLDSRMKSDWLWIDNVAVRPEAYKFEDPPFESLAEKWEPWLKELLMKSKKAIDTKDLENKEKEIDIIIQSLRKYRDQVEHVFKNTYEGLDQLQVLMKSYLNRLDVTQKLEPAMYNTEVSVYAPNGFYYVRTENMRKIKQHLGW